jgi:hypothetical protein
MIRIWQFILVLITAGACAGRAAIIADWTFETSQPDIPSPGAADTGLYAAESGINASSSFSSGHHADASTVWSSPSGDGSSHSFSSTRWASEDYYQFTTSTLGYNNIVITFEQTSSASSLNSFKFAYSTDGTTFTDFNSSYSVGTTSWSTSGSVLATKLNFDLSSISTINNNATTYFRIIDISTGNLTTTTSRVDDFVITASAVPEPAAYGAISGAGLLALCGWRVWRPCRRRENLKS